MNHDQPTSTQAPRPEAAPQCSAEDQFITVLVIDSRPWSREAHVQALNAAGRDLRVHGFESAAAAAASGIEGTAMVVMLNLDGMALSDDRVAEICEEARAQLPRLPKVIVSDSLEVAAIIHLISGEMRGFIPLTLELPQAVDALRFVAAGGIFIPAEAVLGDLEPSLRDEPLRTLPLGQPSTRSPVDPLDVMRAAPLYRETPAAGTGVPWKDFTERERAVLADLRSGKSNKVIARNLNISEATVKVHVRHIMRKLGVANRTQVALRLKALEQGC